MQRKFSIAAVCVMAFVFTATVSSADATSTSARTAAKLASQLGLGTRMAATLLLNGGFPSSWSDANRKANPPHRLESALSQTRRGPRHSMI